jgi:NAD(P)H dehydrogenase (quinone)
MIAVIGATGNTGSATVKELQALGENPLCIVRNADKAKQVLGANTKTALADIADRPAVEKALKGVKRLFIVTGANPESGEQQLNALEAAKAAGVEFFVKVSGGRDIVGPNVEAIAGRGHYMVEEAMKKSGLAWCVLSPGLFMQNMLAQAASIKNDSKIVQPYAKDFPIAFVDVRDTGAIGARVLRDPAKHAGQIYSFTGVATNFEEFAKVFSEVLGKPVAYVAVTVEQAEAAMKSRGMPAWLVAHLVAIAHSGNNGAFSKENTQAIRDIVGRAPLTTRQFVEAYKGAFS